MIWKGLSESVRLVEKGDAVDRIYLDFSKAFDKISQNILIVIR